MLLKTGLGFKFYVSPSILLNSRECSLLGVNKGVNIPLGDKFHPWGPSSPLGARGKLRMALRNFPVYFLYYICT
jgi:hypothetical protein